MLTWERDYKTVSEDAPVKVKEPADAFVFRAQTEERVRAIREERRLDNITKVQRRDFDKFVEYQTGINDANIEIVDSLQTKLKSAENRIASAENKITNLEYDLSSLAERVSTLENIIENLN